MLLLIDLSSIFYPTYKSAGEDVTHVVSSVVARVRELAGQQRFEHCAIAVDSPKSFRRDLSPEYKANRVKDAVAKDLILKVQGRLRLDGFALFGADGFEADDVLATASRLAVAAGHVVTIGTADKDLLACVTDCVAVLNTSTSIVYGPAEVKAKLGIAPDRMTDYLSLVGDTSDNVPGVRGVGPKHAARLINEFGSLDTIISTALDDEQANGSRGYKITPPSVRLNLVKALADGSLELSRKLIAVRYDVPGIDIKLALAERIAQPLAATGDYMDDEPKDAIEDTISAPPPKAKPVVTAVDPAGTVLARGDDPPEVETKAPANETKAAVGDAPASHAETKPANGDTPVTALAVNAELLTPSDPRYAVALEPRTPSQAFAMGRAVFNSRLFSNIGSAEAAALVIMMGRELGIGSLTMLRSVHIIEGAPRLPAAMIIGLILRSGKADYFKLVESTATKAVYKTHRKDDPDPAPTVFEYTIDDARTAFLAPPDGWVLEKGKKPGNWSKIPRTMLRWRCGTELARAVYPDVVSNLYSIDEFEPDHPAIEAIASQEAA